MNADKGHIIVIREEQYVRTHLEGTLVHVNLAIKATADSVEVKMLPE